MVAVPHQVTIGENCTIDPTVVFVPADITGQEHPIKVGDGCRVGPFAVIYGGAVIGDGCVIDDRATVGKPEWGYAVGTTYDGSSGQTRLGDGVVLRPGAFVYGDCSIGSRTTIGHNTVIRSASSIGSDTQIAHMVSVERACRLGSWVRCSPLTHITSQVVAEDRVFFGAGVTTINDKGMQWHEEDGSEPVLEPPHFAHGCRIGTGSTVAAGVRIGRESLIGSKSLVVHDVPDGVVAFGSPARVVRAR